jgi:hypothetical protein
VNAYISPARFKAENMGMMSAAADDVIAALVEEVSRGIDAHCHREFIARAGTRYFDGSGAPDLWLPEDLASLTSIAVDLNGDGTFETTVGLSYANAWPYNRIHEPIRRLDLTGYSGAPISAWPAAPRSVALTGTWGYSAEQEIVSTLATAITDAAATTLQVGDGHNGRFNPGDTIIIGSEHLSVVSVGGDDVLTVERGVNGFTAATHLSGATIYRRRYPRPIERACLMQASRLYKRRESAFASVLNSTDLGTVAIFRGLDPDIQAFLSTFRRVVVA